MKIQNKKDREMGVKDKREGSKKYRNQKFEASKNRR